MLSQYSRFLGILLCFRQAVSDDRFFEDRSILAHSLRKIIVLVGNDDSHFLDTVRCSSRRVKSVSEIGEFFAVSKCVLLIISQLYYACGGKSFIAHAKR